MLNRKEIRAMASPNNPSVPQANSRGKANSPIADAFTRGQVRMAHGLCGIYNGKLIFVPEIGWHYWDSVRWREDTLGQITQFVLKTIHRAMRRAAKDLSSNDPQVQERGERLSQDALSCQTANAIDGIAKLARTWPEFATPPKALDADPYVINLANRTLNLKTGESHEHTPTDLITKVCNARLVSDARCPVWDDYLSKVLPDNDVRSFVQKLMGLALVGMQLEHVIVIFKGNGRNGKGVFEETIRYVLGDYAVAAASDLFTASPNAHTTSQTDLMGSRLAVIDETESDAKLSEALMKKMTGGGTHTARRMRQNNIRFPMTWLPLMVTNHLPKVSSQGADIWDRLVIVDFPTYFAPTKQDKFLREKLKAEADGIFAWAYRGWQMYQNAGHTLELPQAVIDERLEYRHSQDKLQLWVDTRCQLGSGDLFKTKPALLIQDYNGWAMKNGAEQLGKKQFLDLLRRKNFRYVSKTAEVHGVRLDPSRGSLTGAGGLGEAENTV
jgi:putative DNA primase/helicase